MFARPDLRYKSELSTYCRRKDSMQLHCFCQPSALSAWLLLGVLCEEKKRCCLVMAPARGAGERATARVASARLQPR